MNSPGYTAENLEKMILEKGEDETHIRKFLTELATSRIYVLLDRPWDGLSVPSHETRLLHVTDGDNKNQPMLAVFTSQQALGYILNIPDNVFKHAVLVDAAWAFLGVTKETGILVNPNSPSGSFRIGSAVAWQLRGATEQHLNRNSAPNP